MGLLGAVAIYTATSVVDELLPRRVVADGVVEVVFEPACLVAPDGSTGGPGRNRAKNIEVEPGGIVDEPLDALDTCEMEGGVELAEVVGERVALSPCFRKRH